jgi:hypothetical protein
VCNCELSTVLVSVPNESCLLQRRGDDAHGRTMDTKHDGQELVAETKVLLVHTVVSQ